MPGGMWGEGNTRSFLAWADQCQKQAMAQRGLHLNTSVNFSNISMPKAIEAKNRLLDLIQSNRQISVASLYNVMPGDLCSNPTTKTLLMQLYYENNLRIESSQNSSGAESNYILIFDNRKREEQRVVKTPTREIIKNQSNIEDLIDNNWRATGRKLEFEKKERPVQELNISLKKEKPKQTVLTREKPVQDVRSLFKSEVQTKGDVVAPKPKKEIQTPPPTKEIKPISMPEIEIKLPEIEIAPVVIPDFEPIKVETPKLVFDNDLEFAGLTCFELYLLEMYFFNAAAVEKDKRKKEYYKTNSKLCRTKGDILYLEEGNGKSGIIKFILGLLSIFIITIPIYIAYSKNKIRLNAKKEYLRLSKKLEFEQIKNNFKNKYPKVVKE